jgi:hypothetical protein
MPVRNSTSAQAASISLVTSSHDEAAQYHLMELTPDLVQLFEGSEGKALKGIKRGREDEIEEGDKASR